jgi:hypothetical protein
VTNVPTGEEFKIDTCCAEGKGRSRWTLTCKSSPFLRVANWGRPCKEKSGATSSTFEREWEKPRLMRLRVCAVECRDLGESVEGWGDFVEGFGTEAVGLKAVVFEDLFLQGEPRFGLLGGVGKAGFTVAGGYV